MCPVAQVGVGAAPARCSSSSSLILHSSAQEHQAGSGPRIKPSFEGRERGFSLGLGHGRDPKSAVQLQPQEQ